MWWLVLNVMACADLTGSQSLPAGISDPASFRTADGAMGMYTATLYLFHKAAISYLVTSGRLTDELGGVGSTIDSVDTRQNSRGLDVSAGVTDYAYLQNVRGQAMQAFGSLTAYAPKSPVALRSELLAIQGYAELLLADLYCSGVPLSTVDFDGDYTYQTGSSTEDVYRHALRLFDSALTVNTDDTQIMDFARLGKARALMNIGEYAQAATAIANVPVSFQYAFPWTGLATAGTPPIMPAVSVSDREGGRGLPYRTGKDPRIGATFLQNDSYTMLPEYLPSKYVPVTSAHTIVIASGIEAQLMRAEITLHSGDITQWLQILNQLRTDGLFTTAPHADPKTHDDSIAIDTLWNAGTGNVAGLKPLTDPGTDTARITLLFNERASWLFLTGQRQGDLRRLIRQYGRNQADVYPSHGLSMQGALYGNYVNLPITVQDEGANPLFRGCLSKDA